MKNAYWLILLGVIAMFLSHSPKSESQVASTQPVGRYVVVSGTELEAFRIDTVTGKSWSKCRSQQQIWGWCEMPVFFSSAAVAK